MLHTANYQKGKNGNEGQNVTDIYILKLLLKRLGYDTIQICIWLTKYQYISI